MVFAMADPTSRLPPAQSAALFVGLLVLVFVVAAVGGLSTASGVAEWYPTLDKPPWTPPNWAFGPVWTTLYTAMAIAMWDVARRDLRDRTAWAIWATQLTLNLVWSPLFFGARQAWPALAVIAALWVAISVCIGVFWSRSRFAAVLLVPYLAWVSIAASLNGWIAWFN
jgi:tryptophan-rich sensory protein